MTTNSKEQFISYFYPIIRTDKHNTVEDSALYKRYAIYNLWMFCKQEKILFNKITYQKSVELENSLKIHSVKHPEIVSLGKRLFPRKKDLEDSVYYLYAMRHVAKFLLRKILREYYICKIYARHTQRSVFHFEYEDDIYTLVLERVYVNKYFQIVNGVTFFKRSDEIRR